LKGAPSFFLFYVTIAFENIVCQVLILSSTHSHIIRKQPVETVNMLEYFTSKKAKKHHEDKKATGKEKETMVKTPPPLLNDEDEQFLTRIVSAEGTPPPLPTRPNFGAEAGDSTGNDAQMVVHDGREDHGRDSVKGGEKGKGKENETENKKENKFTGFLGRTFTKRVCCSKAETRRGIYG
jgi:hypothetical protein